jgi:hypothetical protein
MKRKGTSMETKKVMTKHHRKMKTHGGSDDPSNIYVCSEKRHQAFHTLFGCMNAEEIARELSAHWIDSDYYLECRKRTKTKKFRF